MTGSAKQSIARAVIASEAKQSISPRKGRMDCFASLAMTSRHAFTTSPRDAPEALHQLSPKEGAGNAGCPLHPRPRVHLVLVERTRVTTSTKRGSEIFFSRALDTKLARQPVGQISEAQLCVGSRNL